MANTEETTDVHIGHILSICEHIPASVSTHKEQTYRREFQGRQGSEHRKPRTINACLVEADWQSGLWIGMRTDQMPSPLKRLIALLLKAVRSIWPVAFINGPPKLTCYMRDPRFMNSPHNLWGGVLPSVSVSSDDISAMLKYLKASEICAHLQESSPSSSFAMVLC
jgi:hypothetical protein